MSKKVSKKSVQKKYQKMSKKSAKKGRQIWPCTSISSNSNYINVLDGKWGWCRPELRIENYGIENYGISIPLNCQLAVILNAQIVLII